MGAAEKKKDKKKGEEEEIGFKFEIVGQEKELGMMQFTVLTAIKNGKFEESVKLLEEYKKLKWEFDPFKKKTENVFDLIYEHLDSLKSKVLTPNIKALLQAKQEEIYDTANENWENIKALLKKLRLVEREFAQEDAKSSLIVVKSLMIALIAIFAVYLVQETFGSLGVSFTHFVQMGIDAIVTIFD